MKRRLDSRDPIERRDAARELIRSCATDSRHSDAAIARATNHSPPKWCRLQMMGERAAAPLADLPIFVELFGARMLEPYAELAGQRLVPRAAPGAFKREEAFASIASLMREAGEAVATAIQALGDGAVTPEEDAHVRRQLDDIRRACGQVEARLDEAKVTPFRSGVSRR